ncbi:uncharacterized protein [Rutidosis leptorrhynchoides]|uniref:uncharacterized protein n=1 Tax=Rutidosis leptorrhynchoides TaxID=125765 RepID=UPI003A98DA26
MTNGRCHQRRKMMGRSANGGCGTEEIHCPVSTSRLPNKLSPADIDIDTDIGIDTEIDIEKDGPLAQTVGIDLYTQACKALSTVSPFDVEDGLKKTSGVGNTLPGGLASCLTKQTDNRKRKKSHFGSDTKKNKSSSRQEKSKGSSIWVETEDYFRELSVEDIEKLSEASFNRGNKFILIPFIRNNGNETNREETNKEVNGDVVAGGEEEDVNHLMEVDVVGANEVSEREKDDAVSSIPQSSTGVEWLLGSRSKIYLTSERPSKKRKLLGGDAGLEKLLVARPVKDQGESTRCHYCSLGDMGDQLNRLIVCTSCGVAVHQRCYGVQQDDRAGCWLCSWCKLKKDEDKSTDGRCLLCPHQGGALKPVRKRGVGNDDDGLTEFAHLFCCQWMPEVYIEDTKSMEPIVNIEGIKEMQKKLVCYLCKVKCGACVRCSSGACRTSFHPLCAREARQKMEIWGKFGCDDVELRAFCLKHSETPNDCAQQVETASFEDGLFDTISSLKTQAEFGKGVEAKGSSTLEDVKVSESSSFSVHLKKKNLKLKLNPPCLSKGEKEGGNKNGTRASDYNAGNSFKSSQPQKMTKNSIRVLKDNNLVLSLKRSSVADGVKNGASFRSVESSPDSMEKISVDSCPADHKGDTVNCISPSQHGRGQVNGAAVSGCEPRVKSGIHDCPISTPDVPDATKSEASPGSYVHPLVLSHREVLSQCKADEDDICDHLKQNSTSTESSCELTGDLGKTKLMSIVNMSPIDEVEGELIYYQCQLLGKRISKKNINDVLISKVMHCLPQEIEASRKQNWDAVLVSQYLSDLREVKKQGRKERRHKEAQSVLAAATAAAAASSRLSSLRKDTVDESAQQENTFKIKSSNGRSAIHAQQLSRAKETHPKLSVTWTNPEMNSVSSHKLQSRVCEVCTRTESFLNPIIVCSSCKVAVHIDCYRSVKDSTGPWYCELCEDLSSSRSRGITSVSYSEKPSLSVECCLCGCRSGAFRKSTDGQWVHAFCAEWVLESTFRRGQVNRIDVMEAISRGHDFCFICSRRVGVCIKCSYGHCQSAFHPACGRTAGFFMNVRNISGKIHHKAYCEKHSLVEKAKAETQKHGVEEWNSMKKVRVELERLRLICERIIRREKLKRELVLCSHEMLRWNRESVCSSMRACTAFVSPDVSSESATTSLRGGYTNSYNKSCSETIQRSDDITIDSTVAGKRRIKFPMAMDTDQKTDDSSTSQIFTQTPMVRPVLAGKQIPQRPSSAASHSTSDDGENLFHHDKHTETFEKELVMTSDQASMRNQRLPKGYVYVPIRCLSNEEETIAVAGPASEENSGQGE